MPRLNYDHGRSASYTLKDTMLRSFTSPERACAIIHDELQMTKVSTQWALKCLGPNQKRVWCNICRKIPCHFQRDLDKFLTQFDTVGETLGTSR